MKVLFILLFTFLGLGGVTIEQNTFNEVVHDNYEYYQTLIEEETSVGDIKIVYGAVDEKMYVSVFFYHTHEIMHKIKINNKITQDKVTNIHKVRLKEDTKITILSNKGAFFKEYIVENHEPSLLPEGKEWKLVWNDEFDGDTLDETKWDFRLHLFHKPHPAYTTKGISFDGNSNLIMSVFEENGQFYSPQLQTGENFLDRPNTDSEWPVAKFKEPKFLHKYGYYEARVKLQKQKGWWSAFWVQSPTIGCSPNPETAGVELDIMECFTPGIIAPHTIHWGG